jgi:nucleotide-binding universal stress UspA family protein
MSLFRKILVPVDFSAHSEEALRVSGELARTFDATVTLVNVFQIPIYALPEGAFIALPSAYAEATLEAGKQLEAVAAAARAVGMIAVETKVLEGIAFREIVRFACDGAFDLIVMGTHGRTGIKHALLGSVAEKVVRKAPCAVLTVRLAGHTFEHP